MQEISKKILFIFYKKFNKKNKINNKIKKLKNNICLFKQKLYRNEFIEINIKKQNKKKNKIIKLMNEFDIFCVEMIKFICDFIFEKKNKNIKNFFYENYEILIKENIMNIENINEFKKIENKIFLFLENKTKKELDEYFDSFIIYLENCAKNKIIHFTIDDKIPKDFKLLKKILNFFYD